MSYDVHPAADLFPLLDDLQLADLAGDIHEHGLREPVWLYDDPEHGTVLLDGRNRVKACELAGVPVRTQVYAGDDPTGFSVSLNLKRRHLTEGQKAAIAAEIEPLYAQQAEQQRRRALAAAAARRERDQQGRLASSQTTDEDQTVAGRPSSGDESTKSRERAAKTAGTSGRSVARFKRLAKNAPDLAAKVKAGTLALTRAERIVRDRDAEAKRVEQAKREAAATATTTRVDIRAGDFRRALDDLTGVDAVITDPPYAFEYLPLLDELAAWADKVLTPDGVLVVLFGQAHLPDVYRRLGGHRPYRWTGCYYTPGRGYVARAAKVQTNWKPLLVYGGGPRFADVVRASGVDDAGAKDNHRWGQDYQAFHDLVERFTERGDIVADPFCGSGTTLLAAHALGRHAIGCDIDAESVAKARERLS